MVQVISQSTGKEIKTKEISWKVPLTGLTDEATKDQCVRVAKSLFGSGAVYMELQSLSSVGMLSVMVLLPLESIH